MAVNQMPRWSLLGDVGGFDGTSLEIPSVFCSTSVMLVLSRIFFKLGKLSNTENKFLKLFGSL
jgi:hypothetical protein